MRRFVVLLLFSALAGCTQRREPALLTHAQPTPYAGVCHPYGSSAPPAPILDPLLGGTPCPTSTPDLAPTCTPFPTSRSPFPTVTPWPTLPGRHAERPPLVVSSAPQNLSLSAWDELLDRVAVAGNVSAVTWHGADPNLGALVTLRTPWGSRTLRVREILGVDGVAGVAISPGGRIHLVAGGRYVYSDDDGSTWSAPTSAPAGDDPHLVVEPSGYARLFYISGGTLHTSLQQPNGAWGTPVALLSGVRDYDAVRVQDGVVVAATNGDTVLYRFPDGGVVATFGQNATRVRLTYRRGEVMVGLGRGGGMRLGQCAGGDGAAFVSRSRDDGQTWDGLCMIQATAHPVGDVAAFPTAQGPYAVLWSWCQPARPGVGPFPYIVLSALRWTEMGCAVVPGDHDADYLTAMGGSEHTPRGDALVAAAGGPPGLFVSHVRQEYFRLAISGEVAVLAFEGLGDVFVADVSPDGIFSGPPLSQEALP